MRRPVFNPIGICTVMCIILGCSSLAGATEYFVCNQAGTGAGTLANPYRMGDLPNPSLDHDYYYDNGTACSVLQPGDTLTFLGGTYTFNTRTADGNGDYGYIHPVRSGTASAPITFRAKPGDTVILRTVTGTQPVFGSYAAGIGVMTHIRFVGLYAEQNEPYSGGQRMGVSLRGDYGEVAYCQSKGRALVANDNYAGFRIEGASHPWIHHCEALNWNSTTANSISGVGIQAYSNQNMLAEHNYCHDNNVGLWDKLSNYGNTYDSNYCVNNIAHPFLGSSGGIQDMYTLSNNVLFGPVEIHTMTTGAMFHDNLIIDSKEGGYASRNCGVSAYAGGDVYQTGCYNNIVFASTVVPSQFYAYYNPYQTFTTTSPNNSLSYFDYNAYQAAPVYDFAEYSGPHVVYTLAQMQGYGFELHATVASKSAIFTDTVNYQVKAPYTTAGRYGDCLGPDNPAAILDTTRYGPQALPIPTATADSYTTGQNTQLVVSDPGLLSNDTCSDGWALSAVKLSNPSHGTLTLSSTGGFTYTPTTGYTGQDSFTYYAKNAYAESTTTTVTLTISGTSVPTTVNDSYSTSFNTQLVVSAANGVLANDSGSGTLTAIKVTDPSHGSLSLSSDGSFTYTPTTGYSGSDSYTYKAHNSYGDGNTATVTITIGGSVPTAVNDSYSVYANHTLTVAAASGLLINDTGTGTLTAIKVTDPSHGSLSLASDGSFTYTPTTGYTGSDSYTYKAHNSNGDSNTATVSITVNTPGAPTATNDSYSTTMNQQLVVASATGLLLNDTDSTGLSLTASKVSDPSHGTVTVNSNGGFTYTPTTGYTGSDSFGYKAYNGFTYSSTATASITINADATTRILIDCGNNYLSSSTTPNSDGRYWNNFTAYSGSPSVITSCTTSTGSLSGVKLTRTTNFFWYDPCSYITTSINGWPLNAVKDTLYTSGTTQTGTMEFSLLDTTGSKTYDLTVFGSFSGAVTARYTVLASSTTSQDYYVGVNTTRWATFSGLTPDSSGKITLQVRGLTAGAPLNVMDLLIHDNSGTAPTAVNDSYSTAFNQQLVVAAASGLLINDTGTGTLTAIKVSDPSHGSLSLSSDGSFTYTPTTGYAGSDSFTYKAHNSIGDSNTATVSITVNNPPAPTAVNDSYSTAFNQQLVVASASGLLLNDTDSNGLSLTASKVSDPSHGSVTVNSNGGFTYTPTTGYAGSDSFGYKAYNGYTYSSTATVSITVNNPPAPTAVNDSYSTAVNQQLVVASASGLLLNDTDSNGLSLTASKVSDPSHGSVTVNSDGGFTYTPTTGYAGSDSFGYKAYNGYTYSSTATVSITISSVPTAVDDSYSGYVNHTLTVAAAGLLLNDTGSGTLTAIKVADPSHGSVTVNSNGGFTYTPTTGYTGSDSFTYKAHNSNGDSNTATATIAVNQPTRLLIDVGSNYLSSSTTPNSDGRYWNNFTAYSGSPSVITSCTTAAGNLSGITLTRTTNFYWHDPASYITAPINGWPVSAVKDFLETSGTTQVGTMEFSLLDTTGSKSYDLTVFGSVSWASTTRYTVVASSTTSQDCYIGVNTTRWVTFSGLTPDASGKITLKVQGLTNAAGLNVMDLAIYTEGGGSGAGPNSPSFIQGDINGDNYVDGGDLNLMLTNWNTHNATRAMGDLNGDGYVNGSDLNLMLTNWKLRPAPVGAAAPAAAAVDPVFTAQVNFQPASSAAPAGYLVDSGLPFSVNAKGYSYGWSSDLSALAVQSNNASSPDIRYDTAVRLVAGGTWEMTVPNGTYDVKIVSGDGGSLSNQKFSVEGVPTTGTASQVAGWAEDTVTVVVTDGRLTIVGNPGSSICFVQITGK